MLGAEIDIAEHGAEATEALVEDRWPGRPGAFPREHRCCGRRTVAACEDVAELSARPRGRRSLQGANTLRRAFLDVGQHAPRGELAGGGGAGRVASGGGRPGADYSSFLTKPEKPG